MRVAYHHTLSDFVTSDLLFARPDWTRADLDEASHELDRAMRMGGDGDRLVYYKAQLREVAGDIASASSWLDRMSSAGPGEAVHTYDYERFQTFQARLQDRVSLLRQRELALPVYLNAMPGAGADFLSHCLAQLLGAFRVHTAKGLWGKATLVPGWVRGFLDGCAVAEDCFPASGENQAILTAYPDMRLSVLVRHPADALWSVHQALAASPVGRSEAYALSRELGLALIHYTEVDRETQLSWLVRSVYPALLRWMESWLIGHYRLGARLAFLRFEDLVTNRTGMAGAVLAHAGYDPHDLPALDGGLPLGFDEALTAAEARIVQSRGDLLGACGEKAQFRRSFSRGHLEHMARWNDSPVFEAFGYPPVMPGGS